MNDETANALQNAAFRLRSRMNSLSMDSIMVLSDLTESMLPWEIARNSDCRMRFRAMFHTIVRSEGYDMEFFSADTKDPLYVPFRLKRLEYSEYPIEKCPLCGGKNVVPIFYGIPTRQISEKIASGDLMPGGEPDQDPPAMYCKNCRKAFGQNPRFMNRYDSGYVLRRFGENPLFLYQESGPYGEKRELRISWGAEECRADMEYCKSAADLSETENRMAQRIHTASFSICPEAYYRFLREIDFRTSLQQWKHHGSNPLVRDTYRAFLQVGHEVCEFENMLPPYWPELLSLINPWFCCTGWPVPKIYLNEPQNFRHTELWADWPEGSMSPVF